ncbi:MAG: hypothetical protein HQL21_00105 [Candidatus Omnitrophica bacterium]|nr:hypothetical protein [Candidatus Omnitrophota bacterium]
MIQKVFFAASLLSFLVLIHPVLAQQVDVDNIRFEVTNVQRSVEGDKKQPYLVVQYQFTNNDEKKKLSVNQALPCKIVDEFSNEYRQLTEPPSGEAQGGRILPNSFPSIYPGETYGETLFFEKPVARANQLRFIIDASPLGIRTTVQIPLKLNPDIVNGVEIRSPLDGSILDQGEVVHLDVRITGGVTPKRVIVLAFGQTYSDDNPSLENVYDINIPPDQTLGPEIINVIAQWRPEHDSLTRSSYINVTVTDALPLDVL